MVQAVIGAAAAASTDTLMAAEGSSANLRSTAADSVHPREEAAELFEDLSRQINIEVRSKVSTVLILLADCHNKPTLMHWNQFVDAITTGPVARNLGRKLPPTGDFLFGGNIQSVCNSLQTGSQHSAQLQKKPFYKQHKSAWQQPGKFPGSQQPRNQRYKPYRYNKK